MPNDAQVYVGTNKFFIVERRVATATSLGIPGTPITAVGLDKIERWVYEVREASDIYFLGDKMNRHPGLSEWLVEMILPGDQVETRGTGKMGFVLMYYGYLNIANMPALKTEASMFWVSLYGSDPVPNKRLYGEPKAKFEVVGGKGDPTAVAYYDGPLDRMNYIPSSAKAELLKNLTEKAAGARP